MPIEAAEPPDDAIEAVRQSMRRRRPRGLPGVRRLPGVRAAPARVSTPQRVFAVGLEPLAEQQSIDRTAQPTGWRFLVDEGRAPVAAAEVQDLTRAAVPAQVTEGAYVQSTVDGLRTAEALEDVRQASFELRLLRVPALYLVALWLQAPDHDDVFMPLDPAPAPFEPMRAYAEPEFAGIAASLARDALERQRTAERPDELGA
jgi:hypothetical protein